MTRVLRYYFTAVSTINRFPSRYLRLCVNILLFGFTSSLVILYGTAQIVESHTIESKKRTAISIAAFEKSIAESKKKSDLYMEENVAATEKKSDLVAEIETRIVESQKKSDLYIAAMEERAATAVKKKLIS